MVTKNQTPTAPALSPARQALQQAIEAQGRAKVLAEKARAVVDAASVALEQARSESVKHEQIAEDGVKARLSLLKGEPGKSAEQLREARRARLIAKEELQASDEVLSVAKQELEQAEGNISRGQKVAASHATSAISESASNVIEEWDRVNLERERLRVILDSLVVARATIDTIISQPNQQVQIIQSALTPAQQAQIIQSAVSQAGLPYGDLEDWKRLQNKIGAALSHNYAQRDPGPSIARARAFWASFADAILADPSVEQPDLPGVDELFG